MSELGHLDEDGRPCAQHRAPDLGALLALALLGSRHAAFNHDIASKLQGLVMSIDEIIELAAGADPELRRSAEAAMLATQELGELLKVHRALGKPTLRTTTTLRDLVTRAAERAGVTVTGELADATLEATVPSLTQAIALALDAAAGPGRGRKLDASSTIAGAKIELALTVVAPAPANASELLALSLSVLRRERGDLRCSPGGDRLVLSLTAAGP